MNEPFIPCDLDCTRCRYNLRGLRADGNCPECGLSVEITIEANHNRPNFPLADLRLWLQRRRYHPIARAAGCSVDAILFVQDALSLAVAQVAKAGGARHAGARELCEAFAEHAKRYFNDEAEARELLDEWGLRTSEDVGRIVFTMVEAKWMTAEEGESVRDFDGLFTLDTLFAGPR
jgi:uncharacterized repeat protein (TIGR04138 family)